MRTLLKSSNCGELSAKNIGEEVTLSGWVACVRDLGGIIFLGLRDRSGFFRVVADPPINPDIQAVFSKLTTE